MSNACPNSSQGILKSAAKEPSVVRFVYTSSSSAATHPIPNKEFTIDSNTWCVDDIKAAWAPPPYTEERAWAVYGASKAQAEQALWQFMKEEKPHFVANAILPNWNIGRILAKSPPTTSGWCTKQLFDGNLKPLEGIPPREPSPFLKRIASADVFFQNGSSTSKILQGFMSPA